MVPTYLLDSSPPHLTQDVDVRIARAERCDKKDWSAKLWDLDDMNKIVPPERWMNVQRCYGWLNIM